MTGRAPHTLTPDGMWRQVLVQRSSETRARKPALFVDRDGTLIELVEYLQEPDKVRLIPEAVAIIRDANVSGLNVVMVTNQSGIERGYYDWQAFAAVQATVLDALATAGAKVDAVYACSSHPDRNAPCRKPNPGMLLAAAADLGLDLGRSWIMGDASTDMLAGKNAGLEKGWLVPDGYGARDRKEALALADDAFSVCVDDTYEALNRALAAWKNKPA